MRKKYQVFISSTYVDLRDERQAAVEAVLMAGHIPAGMELFCAGDESQLDVIKRWIDDSDIYCLILGARYGSIEPKSGKSYTQLEYEYAVGKGKPHFALVLSNEAVAEKRKTMKEAVDEKSLQRLEEFREIVLNKVIRPVDDQKDIKLFTLEAIRGLESRYQLDGWVPASEATDVSPLVTEMARLSSEREELRRQILDLEREREYAGMHQTLAGLDDQLSLEVSYETPSVYGRKTKTVVITWGALFARISPKILEHPNDAVMRLYIPTQLLLSQGVSNEKASLSDSDHDTIKVHLSALGLIELRYTQTTAGRMALFWSLTDRGQQVMLSSRSVKKAIPTS